MQQSALGAQAHEVWLYFQELGSRIKAIDGAIGETDPEAVELATHELEELHFPGARQSPRVNAGRPGGLSTQNTACLRGAR